MTPENLLALHHCLAPLLVMPLCEALALSSRMARKHNPIVESGRLPTRLGKRAVAHRSDPGEGPGERGPRSPRLAARRGSLRYLLR